MPHTKFHIPPLIKHYLDPRNSIPPLVLTTLLCEYGLYKIAVFFGIPIIPDIYWTAAIGFLAYLAGKLIATRTRRYNTLCHLEVELNYLLGSMSDMVITCEYMIKAQMPLLLPHDKVTISIDLVKDVGRIDVKNDLSSLLCDLRKINQDWETIVGYGKRFHSAIDDSSNPGHESVKAEGVRLITLLHKKCFHTLILIKDIALLVRYYIKKDKPFLLFGQPYVDAKEQSKSLKEDKIVLEKEIEESGDNTFYRSNRT